MVPVASQQDVMLEGVIASHIKGKQGLRVVLGEEGPGLFDALGSVEEVDEVVRCFVGVLGHLVHHQVPDRGNFVWSVQPSIRVSRDSADDFFGYHDALQHGLVHYMCHEHGHMHGSQRDSDQKMLKNLVGSTQTDQIGKGVVLLLELSRQP